MVKKLVVLVSYLLVGFVASAQNIFYVDASRPDNAGGGTSWATAKRDLQFAINAAAINDQVWVKAGTYMPTHDPFGNASPANYRDKTFTLKNGVKIYGGFAGTETLLSQRNPRLNVAVLSGDLGVLNTVTDNAYHVVLSVNLGSTTILDGFTVAYGYAAAPSQSSLTVNTRTINRYKGGGIYNSNAATIFANCIIKFNSADCTDGNDDSWGAGMLNDNCSSIIKDCIIEGNYFKNGGASVGVYGAGIMVLSGSCVISNCAFVNNNGGTGFFDASRGGGLYLEGTTSVTNSVFYGNFSQNGAAIAFGGAGSNLSAITNCTLTNNTSSYAGTAFSGFAKANFTNCILWNNMPATSSVAGRDEVYSFETNPVNRPVFLNCIIRDAVGSPLTVINTVLNNCLNSNPLFVNASDADGPDNIIMTADDGLRISCASPAINSGTGNTPGFDILYLLRSNNNDIGAYESGHINSAFNTIPTAATAVQLFQSGSGVTHYSDCVSELLAIQSGVGYTLAGTVSARVWIENSQPLNYVKRHYEIAPQINPSNVTGRVTLYYKQQEFDDFNAVSAIKMPTSPSDFAGVANILLEKRSGESSNGSGLPGSYFGAIQTISNSALNILWNAGAARWEVSFDANGFSGFFLKTQLVTLPVKLFNLSVSSFRSYNRLQWKTENEGTTARFEIERSSNGTDYRFIAAVTSKGTDRNDYLYKDYLFTNGKIFYRVKMIDNDGSFQYSSIVVTEGKSNSSIFLSPNPAKDLVLIASNDVSLVGSFVLVTDIGGRLVIKKLIAGLPYIFNTEQLSNGVYLLHFKNGDTLKLIKTD